MNLNGSKLILSSYPTSVPLSSFTSGCLETVNSCLVGESLEECSDNGVVTGGVKYKHFFNRLYKCLTHLEAENKMLLNMVQQRIQVRTEPLQLEHLMDEFAYKVAEKKGAFERTLIAQAVTEGHQAFMARRWKMRYQNLLQMTTLFDLRSDQQLYKLKELHGGDGGGDDDKLLAYTGDEKTKRDYINEVITLPWDLEQRFDKLDLANMLEDIEHVDGAIKHDVIRQPCTYDFNDFTIPISSVFIQDLLANYKNYADEIKHQIEIKCRLFQVLKKTKEQRNQFKKDVTELEKQIQVLEKTIFEAEANVAKGKSKHLKCGKSSIEYVKRGESTTMKQSSVGVESLKRTESEKNDLENQEEQEMENIQKEIRLLQQRELELEGMLLEEEQQRRFLSKRLQNLVGTIHVFCRIKPHIKNYLNVISDDKLLCPKSSADQSKLIGGHRHLIDSDQMRCFIFETVIRPGVGHVEISTRISHPVSMCLDGYNLCIMTCGPKQSGKSMTMFGPFPAETSATPSTLIDDGVAQNAVQQLFTSIDQRKSSHYELSMHALAVDDQQAHDLLENGGHPKVYPSELITLNAEDIYSKITREVLTKPKHFNKLIGVLRSRQSKLGINTHLVIHIAIKDKSKNNQTRQSTLLFVDLASWETKSSGDDFDLTSCRKTQNLDTQKKSDTPTVGKITTGVNQSLLALSRVFTAMRKRRVPIYQDSLLTVILQPVLSGQSEFFLVMTVSADPDQFLSTLASLQFAQNAMQATMKLTLDQRTKLRSPGDFIATA